jgi:hypothetical protein
MIGLLENKAAVASPRDREVPFFIIEVQQDAPLVGDPLKKLNIAILVRVIILVRCDSILPGLEAVHMLDVKTLIQSVRDDPNRHPIIFGGVTLSIIHCDDSATNNARIVERLVISVVDPVGVAKLGS